MRLLHIVVTYLICENKCCPLLHFRWQFTTTGTTTAATVRLTIIIKGLLQERGVSSQILHCITPYCHTILKLQIL